MQIKNTSKKTLLTIDAREAKTFIDKSVGLIGSYQPKTIMFKTRFGIHTFGVKFPIDVIIFDKKNTITSIKKTMKPNRIFFWNPKYNHVLELPVGTIEKTKTEIGDSISLVL